MPDRIQNTLHNSDATSRGKTIAIIGGGPAGLMAAETLSAQGFTVMLYERKPSVGRKFLMAGRGGLNLTHSEDIEIFIKRYGKHSTQIAPLIRAFPPQTLRQWCEDLGEKTFIGSSGRIFPESFKASPLLRAWIIRLEKQGVQFRTQHDWQGWDEDSLVFNTPNGPIKVKPDATLLALGGASWPRLGADGSWVSCMAAQGVKIAPLRPANCGFCIPWSDIFQARFSGHPLKPVIVHFKESATRGEIMITERGVEGGVIYALSALIREEIDRGNSALVHLDLKPDLNAENIQIRLKKPRGGQSLSNFLRKTLNLSDVALGLLMEHHDRKILGEYSPSQMTNLIKKYPLHLSSAFPIDRAISTAGGVTFETIDPNFMLLSRPGTFVAGEMLDWEAPTGGYLLQGCMAMGRHTAKGVISWLDE
ncbi:MAG: TIGR03862 family flavoprotein [Alphaproteobacteria bacterium]|nr:TIGR03862 family flavoprotein [Alphaproteobacteria bacterium]